MGDDVEDAKVVGTGAPVLVRVAGSWLSLPGWAAFVTPFRAKAYTLAATTGAVGESPRRVHEHDAGFLAFQGRA
jgi:hypothetical protein